MIPEMKVPMSAARHVPSVATSAIAPNAVPITAGTRSARGRGASPSGCRMRPPRIGMARPVMSSATKTMMSGTSSDEPVRGSQLCSAACVAASDWSMPMARPAATVGRRFWNPPTRAAASAGTTKSV